MVAWKPAHSNNITPLRGLAATAVVCHHLGVYAGVDIPYIGRAGGLLGVQLFFLLSGYLIIRSALRHDFSAYAIHRVARILPAYWVAMLVVSVAIYRRSPISVGEDWPSAVLIILALVHFSPHALFHYDVLTVSWTLTIEWCWYLAAIVLARLAPAADAKWWLLMTAAAVALSSIWVLLAQRGAIDFLWADAFQRVSDSRGLPFLRFAFITNAAPAQLGFFMLGCMISRFERTLVRAPAMLSALAFAIFVPFYAGWNHLLGLNPSIASGLGLAGLFVLALKAPPVGQRMLHVLGEISYPVYLIHVPLLLVVFQRWQVKGWTGLIIYFALLLVSAWVLHRFVERPGITYGRRVCSALITRRA